MKDDCASDVIISIALFYYETYIGGKGRAVRKMVIPYLTKQCESAKLWSFYESLWKRKRQRKSLNL